MPIMEDFARLPTQRKVLVFVVGGMMLLLLYYQFVFKSLKADVQEAEDAHEQKLAMNKKLEGDIPKFEALKARMSQLQHIIEENQKALPTEAELPAFFETLNRKVLESGVEVTKWSRKPEENVESFIKVPVDVELTGTYMQIKKFFASLVPKKKKETLETPAPDGSVEERERIVSIENLSLTNPVVRNREIVLTARFTAATYRQEEQKPPPGQPAQPGQPAKPAGQALPPAATPAGAKVRTENAIEKNENRNQKATGAADQSPPAGSGQRLKGGL